MKGKGILIAIVGVLVIGALVYYFAVIRKKPGVPEKSGDLPGDNESLGVPVVTDPGVVMPEPETVESVAQVSTKLDWVKQKAIAEYLTTILQPGAQDDLKNWVKIIEEQRAKDPTKWVEGNGGLYGQVSNIAHGLYQMEVWNNDILKNLKEKQ